MPARKKATGSNATPKKNHKVGDHIDALFEGEYYDAVITVVRKDGTYDVKFVDSEVDQNQNKRSSPRTAKKNQPKRASLSKQFQEVESSTTRGRQATKDTSRQTRSSSPKNKKKQQKNSN